MAWVWKSGYRVVGGKKRPYTYKVWVPDKAPSGSGKKAGNYGDSAAAKRARAKAKAKAAARRAAGVLSAAERKRLARKRLWDSLYKQSALSRNLIAPPTQGGKRPTTYKGETPISKDKERLIEAAKKKQAVWGNMGDFYEAQARKIKDRAALDEAKRDIGSDAAGKTLERLAAEARARQVESKGTDLDDAFVYEVMLAYEQHAEKVSSEYKLEVGELKKFYKTDKNGNLISYKSQDAYEKAQEILNSKKFKTLESEFLRLYGDGKNEGSVTTAWYANVQPIKEDQLRYLATAEKGKYMVAYSQMQRRANVLRSKGDWVGAAAIVEEWEKGDKYLFEYAKTQIDPAKTSIKAYTSDKNDPDTLTAVYRTVEEEFEYRRAQYEARMRQEYAEWRIRNSASRRGFLMRQRHVANSSGNQQQRRDSQYVIDTARSIGIEDPANMTREEQNRVVEESMKKWEAENRKWFRLEDDKSQGRFVDPKRSENATAWTKAKEAQRERFYRALSSEAPGAFETALNLPLIKEGIAALSGAGGSITSGVRVVAKITTGSSTINFPLRASDFPKEVLSAALDAGSAEMNRDVGLSLDALSFGSRGADAANRYLENWLSGADGKKFAKDIYDARAAKAQAQDDAFAKAFYGQGDVWSKLSALGEYGAGVTSDDAMNLALQLGLDPTNAIPLKFTTYLARLAHAKRVTEGVTGLKGARRLSMGAHRWIAVTEPELRFEKALKPHLDKLGKGVDPAKVTEDILAELAGIVDGPTRAKETAKLFRKYGIDRQYANEHGLTSLAEEAIVKRLTDAGVDYKDIARQAMEVEKAKRAEDLLKKAERSKKIDIMDAKNTQAEVAARIDHEKASAAKRAEMEADIASKTAAARARAAKPSRPVTIAQRVADNPLERASTTPGHTDQVYIDLRAGDPIRRAAMDNISARQEKLTQQAADVVHLIDEGAGHHGYQFAPGAETEAFLKSTEYADLVDSLASPDLAVRQLAEETMYEVSHRSMADYRFRQESIGVPLQGGRIPWRTTTTKSADGKKTKEFVVKGGRESGHQYVAGASDLRQRAGAVNPAEELTIASELRVWEATKKRALSLRSAYLKGRISLSDYREKMLEDVATLGLRRFHGDLSKDISSNMGESLRAGPRDYVDELDPNLIPTGGVLFEDLAAAGHLNKYYETFSMLPDYLPESDFMAAILNPAFRETIDRKKFASLLRLGMFTSESVGPVQFREAGAHLFALFHMTLLDKNMTALEAYSKSIQVLLKNDPSNIYGRMWQVMETRAGLPWADSFLATQRSFQSAAILGKRLHPNLALAMIPYGPLARHLPTGHGFTGHLRGLGVSLNPIFAMAPANWTDESVVRAMQALASRVGSASISMRSAVQIAHYMVSRYGSSLVRSRFRIVLQDFSIEASWRTMRDTDAFKALRDRYIEARVSVSRLDEAAYDEFGWRLPDETDSNLAKRVAANNAESAAAEFDGMFVRSKTKNKPRLDFPDLRNFYDDMYWRNELTHDAPGLHTAKFLEKMADPKLQRGDSWLPFASSYYDHMVGAGAENEARTLLRTVFEPEIGRSSWDAYEKIMNMGTTRVPGRQGAVDEFFLRSGLLDDLERMVAEGRRRKIEGESYAESEVKRALMQNEWTIEDAAKRGEREVFEKPGVTSSMYDNADLDELVSEMQVASDEFTKAADERLALADLPQPSSARIGAAVKQVKYLLNKGKWEEAQAFMRGRADDIRPFVFSQVRMHIEYQKMTRLLNSVVRKTIDVESMPYNIEDQMRALVAIIDEMPEGKILLGMWSDEYSQFLYQSRLIDYLKHEEWFKAVEPKATGVDPVFTEPQRITAQLSGARDALRAAKGDSVDAAQKRVDDLEAELSRARTAAHAAGEARSTAPVGPDISGQADELAPAPIAPTTDELNHEGITMAQRALEVLGQMTEEQWLARELQKTQARIKKTRRGTIEYRKHRDRILDIQKAFRVIEVSRAGKGSYISLPARKKFTREVVDAVSERAKAVIAPARIAPYIASAPGANVEWGRSLNRLRLNAPVDPVVQSARKPGEVSEAYAKHGDAIEATFDRPIRQEILTKYGFPADMLDELTGTELMTNLDEFEKTITKNSRFRDFILELDARMTDRLKTITGDETYTVTRWLDDRLVSRGDYMDIDEYQRLDKIVQEAIQRARNGNTRSGQLNLPRRPGNRGENPILEMVETDIRAVIGKSKALAAEGVSPHMYNEARKVLSTGMLRRNRSISIMSYATDAAMKQMDALGKKVDDADWDKLYRKAYDEAYLARRKELTDVEATKLLEELTRDSYGSTAKEIAEEFEARFALDEEVKGFEPKAISPFQKKTLDEAVKKLLRVKDLDNVGEMQRGLSAFGQAPPFHDRGLMRDYLVKYGFWSPRTGEAFEAGKKSWSIQEEMKYYKDNWATAPPWADATLWEEGGDLHKLLFDEVGLGEMHRRWGLFNRNMEARFMSGKMSLEERARFLVEGSEALGLKAKRDLASERKYVMDRFGPIVQDEAGNLTAFPWLMHRDELRAYVIRETGKGSIPEGIVQDLRETEALLRLVDKYTGQYFDEFMMAGKPATYEDVYVMAAKIVRDLLRDPIWLERGRDNLGKWIRRQAEFRRRLVFIHIGFMTTNLIDLAIKGPFTAFATRSFRTGTVSAKAAAYGLLEFGLERGGSMFKESIIEGTERISKPGSSVWDKLLGLSELPAQYAGKGEDFTKLRLAQSMYDGAYKKALKRVGDENVADAIARKWVGEEVSRFWPTSGDGPIERLLNNFMPFLSYQFKNRVLFLSELAGHPAFFNYFNAIGDFIEKQNRARFEKEHPNEVLDETLARLIEIPFAPGMFIDLGQFTDIQRGLKPLYQAADGKMRVEEFLASFVHIVGANDVNIALGVVNALNLSPRYEWMQGRDEDGFPNGVWTKVQVPWLAPWGETANAFNSFWPIDMASKAMQAMKGGFTTQETVGLAFQTLFFGGLKAYDKGAGLQSFFFALKSKDPEAAKLWLEETPEGASLQAYWLDKAPRSQEIITPNDVRDLLNPPQSDSNPTLHRMSKEMQAKVKQGWDDLRAIREEWDRRIWGLTPGTQEYTDAKLQAATARYQYYADHPWMYDYEAASMSPQDWAKQLNDWQVDELVDSYFAMEPPESSGLSAVEYQEAMAVWKRDRALFLKEFPQVAERLGRARSSVEQIWKDTESGWFDVLDKVGTQSIAIEAARQAEDFDLVDQLYIIKELDFNVLSEDQMVYYFDPTTDFQTLPRDFVGPPGLKAGPFGQKLLPSLKVLPDFNKWRFDRMSLEEKAQFERDEKYGTGMKEIIKKAKADGKFDPGVFSRELKKDSWMLEEYFRRNKGKREQWAETDEYIRLISKYGILAKQGKFAEAGRYFDSLPPWVKSRYYKKHTDRRAAMQENMVYMNYMQKWTNFYRKRDYAGGSAFFDKLPPWVKDRYYANHPEKKKFGGGSAYSKAMGRWVKLLQEGKKDEAKAYFDGLPKAYKDRYYAKHPDQKLKNDIKRVGQLGQYFAADDSNRALYLKENPEFAKWLRAQGSSEQTRRMMIMAAYQGLPKDDQWLRRVFREKYPEIFSQEAKGEASLKKTYAFLTEHPDMLPAFEKWLDAVWASYDDMVKNTGARPKPVASDHGRQQHRRSRSAAWVRLHSTS